MFCCTRRLFRPHSGLGKVVRYSSDEAKAKAKVEPQQLVVKFMGSATILISVVASAVGGFVYAVKLVDEMMTKYKPFLENLEKAIAIVPEFVKVVEIS